MIDRFRQIETTHAKLAIGDWVKRVTFDLFELAVFRIEQNAAAVMTTWRRILIGASYGVVPLLPLEFTLMIGFAINAIEELLIIECHAVPFLLLI